MHAAREHIALEAHELAAQGRELAEHTDETRRTWRTWSGERWMRMIAASAFGSDRRGGGDVAASRENQDGPAVKGSTRAYLDHGPRGPCIKLSNGAVAPAYNLTHHGSTLITPPTRRAMRSTPKHRCQIRHHTQPISRCPTPPNSLPAQNTPATTKHSQAQTPTAANPDGTRGRIIPQSHGFAMVRPAPTIVAAPLSLGLFDTLEAHHGVHGPSR